MSNTDPYPGLAVAEQQAGLLPAPHLTYCARHRRLVERFSRSASERQDGERREQDRVQRYQRERQTGVTVPDPEDARREAIAQAIATRPAGPHNGQQAVESLKYQRDTIERELAPSRLADWCAGLRGVVRYALGR